MMFIYRLMRAVVRDPTLYEEVEHDRAATLQAGLVVLLASAAAGVGAGGWHGVSPETFVLFSIIAMVSWLTWAVITLEIGRRLMPQPQTRASYGELIRTLGFAAAPGLSQIFAAFPVVTGVVFVLAALWMLAAMVIAVRQALDYTSTARALAVCGLGWALAIVVSITLGLLFSRPVG
jgi:hypothetical protein